MDKSPVEISILSKFKIYLRTYPSQFWLLFWGMLVSTTGMSMIWPFLVVYIRQELSFPLATITSLISINAVMSPSSSLIAGSITDKIGQKWAMVISPASIWYGGGAAGIIGSLIFLIIAIKATGEIPKATPVH